MESRVEKHYQDDFNDSVTSQSTRSGRNARLYRQVRSKYEDLDNLPLEDNTNEIDIEKLKELVLHTNQEKEDKELKEHLTVLEQKKRNIDEQRVYDINKILEKAKYENTKLKDTSVNIPKINRDILSTLQSTELSLIEIKKASQNYQEVVDSKTEDELKQEELSMTRELKYKNLEQQLYKESVEESIREKQSLTNDLSLDLFEDLKPTGNTIVTKPIKDQDVQIKQINEIRSSDTSDIDIIKSIDKTGENDFFTSSYHFSKNDFNEDDYDFYVQNKKGGLFKIILLLLAIMVFVGVIVYFIGTYGLGIN